jgi:hypothetical protein
MSTLGAPREKNFDDFRQQCEVSWSTYLRSAKRVLNTITPACLSTASVHPDGFLKIPIGPANGMRDGRVRLHFWLPGRSSIREPHSHPWHLSSLVIAGTYREYLPKLEPDFNGTFARYEVQYYPDRDARLEVRRTGAESFNAVMGALHKTPQGQTHHLPEGPVHMSSPDGSGAITLAVMSPRFCDRSYFFASHRAKYDARVNTHEIISLMDLIGAVRGVV